MKATVETIREIVKVLTTEEQQLLKDTFLFGAWGDTETEFLDEEGKVEIVGAWGIVLTTLVKVVISLGVWYRRCSAQFTRNSALLTVIRSALTFHTVTIGGVMVVAICCSFARRGIRRGWSGPRRLSSLKNPRTKNQPLTTFAAYRMASLNSGSSSLIPKAATTLAV